MIPLAAIKSLVGQLLGTAIPVIMDWEPEPMAIKGIARLTVSAFTAYGVDESRREDLGPSTVTSANFVQPAAAQSVAVAVADTSALYVGQVVKVTGGGIYTVAAITDPTHASLTNRGDTGNAAAGVTVPSGSAVTPGAVLAGMRRFTLSVALDSYDPTAMAFDMLETARLRMREAGSKAALQAAGLALVDMPLITPVPASADTRAITRAVLDVRFLLASVEADVTNDGNWIQTTGPIVGNTAGVIPTADPDLVAWLWPGRTSNPWSNLAPGGAAFVPSATPPTLDPSGMATGKAGLVFDGVQTCLKAAIGSRLASSGGVQGLTVIARLKVTPPSRANTLYTAVAIGAAAGGNPNPGTALSAVDGPDSGGPAGDFTRFSFFAAYFDDALHADTANDSGAPRTAGVYTVTQVSDGTSTRLRVNGAPVAATHTTATSSFSVNQIAIGCVTDAAAVGGANFYTGEIGQVLIIARALTGLELTQYEALVSN